MAIDQLKIKNIIYDVGAKASNVSFDNKNTSYVAENVQAALVEAGIKINEMVQSNTTAIWNEYPQLVSKLNCIYVYTDHFIYNNKSIPAIKIGDGTSYLIDMPFVDEYMADVVNHITNTTIHTSASEKEYWNNKVTCYLSPQDSEILIFTKD